MSKTAEDIKNKLKQYNLNTASSILKVKHDEETVLKIGKLHSDSEIKMFTEWANIIEENKNQKEVSYIIDHINKLVKASNNQKKFTAQQWIDWAKGCKD